jgi:hypothetical protein
MKTARRPRSKRKPRLWQEHSLSLTVLIVLVLWNVLYSVSDERTHWGAFCGNAIADWTGLLTMILVTKSFYEEGSSESKDPPPKRGRVMSFLTKHSLSLIIIATGLAWVALYASLSPMMKWGQVVGNIVSEWTQILALVLFTKRLKERRSKESRE